MSAWEGELEFWMEACGGLEGGCESCGRRWGERVVAGGKGEECYACGILVGLQLNISWDDQTWVIGLPNDGQISSK